MAFSKLSPKVSEMSQVAVATASVLAADIARALIDAGGNAVDVCVGAAIGAMCTDPGIIAPGAGGFITLWPAGEDPRVIDAYAEMPGRGLPQSDHSTDARAVTMEYGGGMETIVGYGSVATPGAFAGLSEAQKRYGRISWAEVIEPTIVHVVAGFPLSESAAEYLSYSHDVIFGWNLESYRALHQRDGTPLGAGDIVHLPDLAVSLRRIAEVGAEILYTGELGIAIAEEIQTNGGILTAEDLSSYEAHDRSPICTELEGWTIATNPPPAVGGACMAAMLVLLDGYGITDWGSRNVATLAKVQQAVTDFRRDRFDISRNRGREAEFLLEMARIGKLKSLLSAPSTSHTSAVDSAGNACSITVSAGYGSGVMVPGTGMWLNNSLGELELNPEGFQGLPAGTRLVSNMAPTVARRADGAVIAIGSPGADRITTAISQVLFNCLALGMSMEASIEAPRLHMEIFDGEVTAAHEPGLNVSELGELTPRPFSSRSMYFGGVQAAAWYPDAGLVACADARRAGGTSIGGR